MTTELPNNKKIILFDGVCNLCEKSVQFIIKYDKKDIFRFVSIQSTLGKEIIYHIKIDTTKIDSIILYEPNIAYYYKAEAALRIAKELKGIVSILSVFFTNQPGRARISLNGGISLFASKTWSLFWITVKTTLSTVTRIDCFIAMGGSLCKSDNIVCICGQKARFIYYLFIINHSSGFWEYCSKIESWLLSLPSRSTNHNNVRWAIKSGINILFFW